MEDVSGGGSLLAGGFSRVLRLRSEAQAPGTLEAGESTSNGVQTLGKRGPGIL